MLGKDNKGIPDQIYTYNNRGQSFGLDDAWSGPLNFPAPPPWNSDDGCLSGSAKFWNQGVPAPDVEGIPFPKSLMAWRHKTQ